MNMNGMLCTFDKQAATLFKSVHFYWRSQYVKKEANHWPTFWNTALLDKDVFGQK